MNVFSLNGNWVDFIILIFLAIYVLETWSRGFVLGIFDLLGFIFSVFAGFWLYSKVAYILISNFSMPRGISNALGFIFVVFMAEFIFYLISAYVYQFTDKKIIESKLNLVLGFVPALFSGLIISSFLLMLIVVLPVRPNIKQDALQSKIGSYLIDRSMIIEKGLTEVFGGALQETLTFLTVKPEGSDVVDLKFKTKDFSVDTKAEEQMFALVNRERALRGVIMLVENDSLKNVARAHCEDMFTRGYFSHYTPEGISPFDRMNRNGISYSVAGENLAYAPSVDIAHTGLMNSPGHRANILSNDFGKVGIGVINAGIYGSMFCQEFTD
ncbi:MAG: hypothetical protein A2857_02110 [Candidatus Levybacteria bacterium RIFCSPHIGHO2_01_FULL_36_15]|nr:MAG: hypothetical protein A2857_02110 [Candidatus Levybacteria bacterium RIFCSPHIGHO2_01_FULL_36_15]OGH38779.1 MAG: hypothetical protein A2905_04460 [Candidatus Levybacteria bacterium RIFCSPLOWO2_01_FULL_36_10]